MEKENFSKLPEEVEQEEINLDEVSGWALFLDYTTDVFKELTQSDVGDEQKEALQRLIDEAEIAYHNLETLVKTASEVLSGGGQIGYKESEVAQEYYDTIAELRDKAEELEEVPEVMEKNDTEQMSVSEEVTDADSEDDFFEEDEELPQEVEVILEESKDSSKTLSELEILNESYKKIAAHEKKIQVLVEEYKDRPEVLDKNKVTAERFVFMQLKSTHERVLTLKSELESGAVEVTEVVATNMKNAAVEIEKNLTQIEQRLKKLFQDIEKAQNTGPMNVSAEIESDLMPVNISVVKKPVDIPVPAKTKLVPKRVFENSRNKEPLIPDALIKDTYHNAFIKEHSITWQQVEQQMRKDIAEVEKVSQFDSWFNVKHGSMFATVLSSMTIKELSEFERHSLEHISAQLNLISKEEGESFTYTSYRKWLSRFDEMSEIVPLHAGMTFAEVCTIYAIDQLLESKTVDA